MQKVSGDCDLRHLLLVGGTQTPSFNCSCWDVPQERGKERFMDLWAVTRGNLHSSSAASSLTGTCALRRTSLGSSDTSKSGGLIALPVNWGFIARTINHNCRGGHQLRCLWSVINKHHQRIGYGQGVSFGSDQLAKECDEPHLRD